MLRGWNLQCELSIPVLTANRTELRIDDRPTFPDFNLLGHSHNHGKKAPNAAAAERALFMTPSVTSPSSSSPSSSLSNQHSSPSLDLDPCTPSTTSTSSKESDEDGDCDWEHPTATNLHYYKLPDTSFQAIPRPSRVHHHHQEHYPYRVNNHRDSEGVGEEAEELTPLEMPDGSTRFTANWLPVDPTGGFTIGVGIEEGRCASIPVSASAVDYGYAYEYGEQDHAYGYGYGDPVLQFSKEAFIQMPAPAPV